MTQRNLLGRLVLVALLASALTACGDDAATAEPGSAADLSPLQLRFVGTVGSDAFRCDQSFALGADGDDFTPTDFRFYVSEVVLLGDGGEEQPVAFVPDGQFQSETVALVDLEDGSGSCDNGTAETHDVLTVEGAGFPVTGVRFTLGVPFEDNHQDVAVAEPPLDLAAMFWNWQGGYKFLRVDGSVGDSPWNNHLGSTGCDGDMRGNVTTCARENRATVTLDAFDPSSQRIRFDLAALLDGATLAENTPDTPPGCMSAPTDPECETVFRQLGLAFGDAAAPEQQVFSVVAD